MSNTYVKTKDGKIGLIVEDHEPAEYMIVIFKSQWRDDFGHKMVTNPEKTIVPYNKVEVTDTNLRAILPSDPAVNLEIMTLGYHNYPRHW